MGQQQLLLVILVTIIVGIATVVAINVFGTSAQSANEDAVRNDVLGIASATQGWYIKPIMMGGGGNSFGGMTFRDFNFSADSIITNDMVAVNMNGTYIINTGAAIPAASQSFTVAAHPASCEGTYVAGTGGCDSPLTATVSQSNLTWNE